MPVPDFADIRRAKDGDKCSQCDKGKLKTLTGIEWGHCFKLDQFYSKPHNGVYKDKDGKEKVMWMGSYGIGLGRSMATIVEANNDARGIIWPESVAPYSVHLVSLSGGEDLATKLYQKLIDKGVDVLWDDRDESAGAKLADADLIGIPTRLLVSKKTGDKIEHKKRNSNQVKLISQDKLLGLFK
jgi:prolyl-tRNA synthetase